jgi:hypothetical protein
MESSMHFDPDEVDQNIEELLQDCYYRFDPRGIEEKAAEESYYEDDVYEMEVNLAGHLFTFDRTAFWLRFRHIEDELRRDLVACGLSHSIHDGGLPADKYEDAYFSHSESACLWQEKYGDEHDIDDLMTLLRMLRRIS